MKSKDISLAKDPDLVASVDAMRRAADYAIQIAIQTNTSIVLSDASGNGFVRISAAESLAGEIGNVSKTNLPVN